MDVVNHGGKRPGAGRPRTGERVRGKAIRVETLLTPTEHATITAALRPTETPAGFLRKYGMAEAVRRAKRKG